MGTPVAYTTIQNALETILKADARTNVARIFVEEEPQFDIMDSQQVIAVFMERRVAGPKDQQLGLAKRTRYHLTITIWVLAFSIESYRTACDLRNTLLDNLELTLMDNRTISNTVTTSWLEGGVMISAKDPQKGVFTAAAETILTAEVSAVNT